MVCEKCNKYTPSEGGRGISCPYCAQQKFLAKRHEDMQIKSKSDAIAKHIGTFRKAGFYDCGYGIDFSDVDTGAIIVMANALEEYFSKIEYMQKGKPYKTFALQQSNKRAKK